MTTTHALKPLDVKHVLAPAARNTAGPYKTAGQSQAMHNPTSKRQNGLTWAITEADSGRHIKRLEVLGLARRWCYCCLLGAKDGIDGRGFADIGVAHQANHQAPVGVLPAQ